MRRTADPALGPLHGLHAAPCARRGPDVSHQRALHRMAVGPRRNHCRGGGQRRIEQRGIETAERGDTGCRTDRGKRRMRVEHKRLGRERARKTRRDLIAEHQRAQRFLGRCAGRLGFGDQCRDRVKPRMAGGAAVAFIEFAPIRRSAVRDRGGKAVRLPTASVEDRRLLAPGARDHPILQLDHLRLVARSDDRGDVVAQHGRGTPHDRFGNIAHRNGRHPLA